MSFSVDLWNGYDIIYNHFTNKRKGLKDFIYMLTSKYDCELEYSKSLKRIYDYNYIVTSEGTLSHGIQAFKNDLLNQYNYTVDFINSFREEIIDPLKKFFNDQLNTGKRLNDEMRKAERDYKEAIERLERSKSRYHISAKAAEEAKLQYELSKINQTSTTERKSQLSNKAQNALKEAKDAEKAYILSLNYANNTRDIFIDATKRILSEFQTLEEKFVEFTKDSLRKYTIFQISLVRNLQYDIEKKAKTMESIDSKADIRDFIEKYSTKGLPPYKFEFIPYTSEVFTKNNENNIPTSIISNVKNFIQNTFLTEPPEIDPDPVEGRANAEIKALVNYAWEGKAINEEERKIFLKHVKEKRYRKYFLNSLNKFRISGLFNLDEKAFQYIGNLMLDSIDDMAKDKDFESTRFFMLLSQTFYKTATEPNKPRIFLQTAIEKHEIWKSMDFWEELIKYSINEEMLNQQNYNIYTFENVTEKQKRIQNLVQSQLISFIYNMLSFDINKHKVKETIEKFADYYTLSEESLKILYKNIDDYLNIVENNAPKVEKDEFFTTKQQRNSSEEIDTNIIKNIISQTLKSQVTKNKEKPERNVVDNSPSQETFSDKRDNEPTSSREDSNSTNTNNNIFIRSSIKKNSNISISSSQIIEENLKSFAEENKEKQDN